MKEIKMKNTSFKVMLIFGLLYSASAHSGYIIDDEKSVPNGTTYSVGVQSFDPSYMNQSIDRTQNPMSENDKNELIKTQADEIRRLQGLLQNTSSNSPKDSGK